MAGAGRGAVVGAVVALVALGAGPAAAQTVRGTVQGRVLDTAGRVVPGAQVVVADEATGARMTGRTDDAGWFVVTSVSPGGYRLEVVHDGFRRHEQAFSLLVNQRLRLDVVLQPGPVTEVVVVRAPAATLDRSPGTIVSRTEPAQVAGLPLDGRNFLDLALLSAGAAPPAPGSAGSVRGDFAFNVNGAREDANAFILDGAANFDPKLNTAAVRPPVDAIREFEVITNGPDASFGRSAGAQVNVVTRSGTNRPAATAYDFLRTAAFNARNAFAPAGEPAPEYRRHQFGGSAGGPLRRDRFFLFGDYEGTRLTEGITRVTSVPTLAERSGDFSASAFPAPFNPFAGAPFPGGQIPAFLQNPIGRAIAALYPLPNRNAPFANFVSSPELVDHVDQFDLRLDGRGDAWTVMARYSFQDRRLFEPFSGPAFAAVPGFGTDVPRRAQNLAVSVVSAVSDRTLNEARVSWTRVAAGSFHENRGASLNGRVGLPELSADPRDWGLSFITVAGYSPLGDEFNNPQDSRVSLLQLGDTVTRTAGRHVVKAGAELRLLAQDAYRDVQSRGFLSFTNQAFTGNALADLLLGLPTVTGGARLDNPQQLRAWSTALFVQETWQASPALTLSAGLRYEYNAPPVDRLDRVNLYDPARGELVAAGRDGMPRGGYLADRNNLAPRLGLAWAVRPDTVVRAGYGISYDQAALAPNEFLYFNSPYFDLNLYFSLPPAYLLTLFDPFPAAFPLPLPDSATAVQRDLRTGYLHHWNAGVQHRLGDRRTVEVSYVGTRGRNLVAGRDLNQPPASPQPFNPRPNPRFADITVIESRARSEYDALQIRYDQRLDGGAALSASYTLSESMDDASGFFASAGDANFPQDSHNPGAEWGRSNFDIRHRFALSGVWELPFGEGRRWLNRGFGATCLGRWDLYAVAVFQSGRPFTVALHPDIDNSNTGRANLGFGSNDRPDVTGNPALANPTPARWFNTSAYAMPAFGTFGNAGRNALDGPGYANVNLALARGVALGPGRFELRLEVFNAFNARNYGQPDNFLGSPTFGQILSAGAPRRLQLGLRFVY